MVLFQVWKEGEELRPHQRWVFQSMHQVYNQIFSVLDQKTILCTFKIILRGFGFFTGKISLGQWMPICSVQKLLSKRNITSKPKIVEFKQSIRGNCNL